MIVTMSKYNFVLHHSQHEAFLEKLQDLGLVDITTTGWEPSDADRALMSSVERHRAAVTHLREIAAQVDVTNSKPFDTGEEAFRNYIEAMARQEALITAITRTEREVEELQVWGDFSPEQLQSLDNNGVKLSYFTAYLKEFETSVEGWNDQYIVVRIATVNGLVHFVVISDEGQTVSINANPIKAPTMTSEQKRRQAEALHQELEQIDKVFERCAVSIEAIEEYGRRLRESLHFNQVISSGRAEAEGTLIIMEAWAARETSNKVDALLEEYPDVLYIKDRPTPEDDTPVLLKNNKFAELFEVIGSFYALPKYGTMDLTPFFAPFYMLFFGFCLGDSGYGLIFVLAGMFLKFKGGAKMSKIASLTMLCGASTILFGALTGSFFGIKFTDLEAFASFRKYILTPDRLFTLAIGIGVFQILFGMTLKVITTTMQFGFKYTLGTIGWMIVIISSIAAMYLPDMGVSGFSMGSVSYIVALCIGLGMMLLLNNPAKNPLANIGAGLWNTYNDVTGLMGDVLSYIRLFAIGLSGSILALVFNDLAVGLSPNVPVVKEICVIIILLIGHGINLFMSSLSSFVHPMRLTFVEFYKNAGFNASQRPFTPFKRDK